MGKKKGSKPRCSKCSKRLNKADAIQLKRPTTSGYAIYCQRCKQEYKNPKLRKLSRDDLYNIEEFEESIAAKRVVIRELRCGNNLPKWKILKMEEELCMGGLEYQIGRMRQYIDHLGWGIPDYERSIVEDQILIDRIKYGRSTNLRKDQLHLPPGHPSDTKLEVRPKERKKKP